MMVVVTGEEYFVDKYLKIHFRTTIHNTLSSLLGFRHPPISV